MGSRQESQREYTLSKKQQRAMLTILIIANMLPGVILGAALFPLQRDIHRLRLEMDKLAESDYLTKGDIDKFKEDLEKR